LQPFAEPHGLDESSQLDQAITIGRGGIFLRLTIYQYAKLKA
jgi:hypothetical protein